MFLADETTQSGVQIIASPERHGGDAEDHRHYDDEQEWPAASDHALPANKALHSTIVTMSLVGCA